MMPHLLLMGQDRRIKGGEGSRNEWNQDAKGEKNALMGIYAVIHTKNTRTGSEGSDHKLPLFHSIKTPSGTDGSMSSTACQHNGYRMASI